MDRLIVQDDTETILTTVFGEPSEVPCPLADWGEDIGMIDWDNRSIYIGDNCGEQYAKLRVWNFTRKSEENIQRVFWKYMLDNKWIVGLLDE